MDAGYLVTQVNNIIGQLHGLFDEIGIPGHERESRESEVSGWLLPSSHFSLDSRLIMDASALFGSVGDAQWPSRAGQQVGLVEPSLEKPEHAWLTTTSEKNDMTEEAHRLIKAIKQMEGSLDDAAKSSVYDQKEDADLHVTYPLSRCLSSLTEKYNVACKLHQERFEQVKS